MKSHTSVLFLLMALISLAQEDFKQQREEMVKSQIHERGVYDKPTLKAMRAVKRHLFVPQGFINSAYMDTALPIGYDQTISQPYIVGLMTASLKLKKDFKVLEIGTGSGYQAAVLAEIVDSVYTIEIVEPLGIRSRELLQNLGYDNVSVRIGDGYNGWPEQAPFDAIIVTAAVEEIPQPLIDQLAVGGKLIVPVGPIPEFRMLQLVTKKRGKLIKKNLIPVRFVPFTRKND